jgi:ferredoxin
VIGARLPLVPGATPTPRVRAAHCRRHRAGNAGCHACALVCPTEAFWVDAAGGLRLQEIDCVGCGACASVCPSQAIAFAGDADGAVAEALRRGDAIVGCRHGGAEGDVRVPCLAALHPELLAGLMLAFPERRLTLNVACCASCDIGRMLPLIEAQFDQASAYATLAGVTPRARLAGEAAASVAPPALSRRALFGALRQETAKLVTGAIAEALGGDAPAEHLPHRAALLASVRRRVAERDGEPVALPLLGAFYVDWDASDRCDGCAGVADANGPRCVAACPSGAWRMGRAGGRAVLSHDAARCTACGLCEEVCPRDALTAAPAPLAADAGRVAKRALPLARCRGCHAPIAAGGDGYCPNCRKRLGAWPGRG